MAIEIAPVFLRGLTLLSPNQVHSMRFPIPRWNAQTQRLYMKEKSAKNCEVSIFATHLHEHQVSILKIIDHGTVLEPLQQADSGVVLAAQ